MNFKSFKRKQELVFEQARVLHRQKFPPPSALERVKRYQMLVAQSRIKAGTGGAELDRKYVHYHIFKY
jgi:hypothetical protein